MLGLSQEHTLSKLPKIPTTKLLTKIHRHRGSRGKFLPKLQCSMQAPSSNTSEKKATKLIGDFGAALPRELVRPQNDHFDSGAFG